jgi:hypothetical protein
MRTRTGPAAIKFKLLIIVQGGHPPTPHTEFFRRGETPPLLFLKPDPTHHQLRKICPFVKSRLLEILYFIHLEFQKKQNLHE